MTTEITEPQKFLWEIFKLEYEQAAQRYENIYKAVWQIFSYMAALTAAILAFASRNIPLLIVIIIAPLPLFFWFFAIFLPMDGYGQQIRKRLSDIENHLNQEFLVGNNYNLKHFSDFHNQKKNRFSRVGNVVKMFAVLIGVIWLTSLLMTYNLRTPVQEPQIQGLSKELQILSNKLDSIESLLRERNKPVTN